MSLRSCKVTGLLLILTVSICLLGCAHKKPVEPPLGTFLEDIYVTENRSQDVDKFRDAMPAYLDQYDKQITPKTDEKIAFKAAGAYYGYAVCFVEDTSKEQASELYLKGRNYAMSELKRYRLFDEGFNRAIPEFRQSLRDAFDKRNIQALYLTAVNWAGWINLNMDKPEARADIPKAAAMLEFVNELDPSYAGGTVHAVLGSLYANRPKADGGDPVSAKEQFELAFSYSGKTIMNVDVMYARFYATQIQDQVLFRETLENVLATPADKYPDKTFVNEIARRKAKVLLDDMDTYFKPPVEKKPEAEEKKPEGEEKKVEPEEPPREPADSPLPEAAPVPPVTTPQTPETAPEPPVLPPVTSPEAADASAYQKAVFYPYTVHLSSYRTQEDALRAYQEQYQELDTAFITKIDLGGNMGIWHRIDYGAYSGSKEAVSRVEELKSSGLIRKEKAYIGSSAPYTLELGVFGKDEAEAQVKILLEKGQVPYIIREPGEVYRVVIGAYPDEKSALPAMQDLRAMDLQPKIVKR
jgi:cell division protein FtsN